MPAEMLPTVTYFATLLGFGVFIVYLTKRIRIPDAFFMLLVGLFLGPTLLGFVDVAKMGDVPDFLRILALIIIVFAGSFHLKMETFKKVSRISLKLSFLGFFFSMFVLGFSAFYIFNISLIGSFILSAIIAGTSSAAVLTFGDILRKDKEIMDILTVESIFSDPLTILVPIILLDAYIAGGFSSTVFISQFWQMIAAGVGTGVVIGLAASELFKRTQRELSPILSFAIAMITYSMATNVGGSGIIAVAICALILGNMNIPYKKLIGEFEDSLSLMLTIAVFTLLGAQITLSLTKSLFIKELIFIAIVIFISRPVFSIFALLKEGRPFSEELLIAFTAPRGIAAAAIAAIPLSYALKNNLPALAAESELILLTVFLVIMFTLLSSTIADLIYSKRTSRQEQPEQKNLGS